MHAVNLARVPTFAAVMAISFAIARRSPVLPRATALRCVLIGVLFRGERYGLLSSVRHIPAELAMLIMYAGPPMIAVAGRLNGTVPFTPDRLFAILAALLPGQRMSVVQLFGGALVIGAVRLVQLSLRVPVRGLNSTR